MTTLYSNPREVSRERLLFEDVEIQVDAALASLRDPKGPWVDTAIAELNGARLMLKSLSKVLPK